MSCFVLRLTLHQRRIEELKPHGHSLAPKPQSVIHISPLEMSEGQFHEARFVLRSANDAPLMPFDFLTPECWRAFFAFAWHTANMRISTAVRLCLPDNKFCYGYISVLFQRCFVHCIFKSGEHAAYRITTPERS